MKCPKCESENVRIQMVKLDKEKKSCLWWTFIGIWWVPFRFFVIDMYVLIYKLIKKKYINYDKKKIAICQECGHHWKL